MWVLYIFKYSFVEVVCKVSVVNFWRCNVTAIELYYLIMHCFMSCHVYVVYLKAYIYIKVSKISIVQLSLHNNKIWKSFLAERFVDLSVL